MNPTTINPFTGQVYEIAADATEPLIIENFDITQDVIQLANNTGLTTIPHLSFGDEYSFAVSDGDTFIKNLYGKIVAIVRDTTDLQLFTGYTPKGTFTLLSLDNEFFSENLAPTFFEPWYTEFDKSDYGNSVQEAIDAGLVDSAYEHYLKFGQYEAREDSLFAAATDGNNTIYGTGYETGLIGVPISDGVYTRDVTPLSTGEGEIDVLVGGTAEDTFFLGNAALLNEKAQAFYVGGGDSDYALIKNFDPETAYGFPYVIDGVEYPGEELADRVFLAGKPYDYKYEKVEITTRISTKDGDLIAIIEGEVTLDAPWSPIPGGFYLYPVDLPTAYIPALFTQPYFNESFYLAEKPEVAEAIANGEHASGYEHYIKVGQFDPETEMILSGTAGNDGIMIGVSGGGNGASDLQFGVPLTFIDGEKEGWTSETTGVGEQDYFRGGMGTTTFFIGNDQILDPSKPIDVYYVGEGDEDFAYIDSFDPYKDFIFAAGNFEDYTIESVEETIDEYGRTATIRNLEISYQGDLVARVVNVDGSLTLKDGWTLQEFDFGDERPNGFAFVAPVNEFLPENPSESPFTGQSFTIDPDATEPLTIENFDRKQDYISLSGAYEDYTFQALAENLQILKDGNLVAVIEGITDLKPFTGYNLEGETYLISLENEFFDTYVEPYFFAPVYPIQNPDVDALIAAGEYESYYDHFLKAGQFEPREDTFLAATTGDDTLYAVGWETILSGVPITQAQYDGGLDVVPSDLGSGQVDTLYSDGGSGKETIFLLGNSNILNDTAQSFYLGSGDEDYALIKNFTAGDRIFLGSDVAGFTQTVIDGNLHIAKDGDLIAIIENRTELASNRANELTSLATESYASGTDGDDIVFGSTRQSNIIGVPLANDDVGGVYATTTGAGEFDILNGSKRGDTFYLGLATTPDGDSQPLYVGNGDTDYALIKGFSTKDIYDSVTLAGTASDYKFEFEAYEGTGDDTKIYTKDGDLIGIVEDVTLSQLYIEGEGISLYASSLNGTAAEASDYLFDIEPFFYEDFYLAENPEVADLIASGEYGSAFEHYLEVGQYAEESEVIFAGTDGDDFIPSIGKSDLVFGVPLTTVDGTVEGWEEASTGVGEKDTLVGGLGVTTFFIGNDQILDPSKPDTVYYVGEGDADYALIQGFQPTQDFIFGAGAIEDYSFETVDGDLKISYNGDLVAILDDIGDLTLQEFPLGEERPRGLALVAPENQFLPTEPTEPTTPIFGSLDGDVIDVIGMNQLIFGGAEDDVIDANGSSGKNRIYAGTGDDTMILGTSDVLLGQDGDDRFFVLSGGNNTLTGGTGADQFWLASAEIPTSVNTVTDFSVGEDVIGIAGIGASFETLSLTQLGNNTLISFNNDELGMLKGIQASSLGADSFAFV